MTHGADMMLRALAMTYSEICKMEVERLKGKKFDKDTLIKYYCDMSKMIDKLSRMQKCGEFFETYLESSEEQHSQWFYDKGYEEGFEDGFDKGKKAMYDELRNIADGSIDNKKIYEREYTCQWDSRNTYECNKD